VPAAIDADSEVCLYRITQEALHNVVKHSHARHARVAITFGADEIVLRVVDDGVGFDPQAVREKVTLGLVSMRERARLLRGTLIVSSKPGEGTAIEVRLPIT
jgi:signal transduction histidine kinase